MKLLTTILLGLGISVNAFAINDDPYSLFDATQYTDRQVAVTWKTADNVQEACAKEARARGMGEYTIKIQACSFWKENTCTVITGKKASMHTLGHEMRHCFQGAWHG